MVRPLPKGKSAIAAAVEQGSIIKYSGQILLRAEQALVAKNVISPGATLALYTTVAVTPLLVLTISAAGAVFATGKSGNYREEDAGRANARN